VRALMGEWGWRGKLGFAMLVDDLSAGNGWRIPRRVRGPNGARMPE